MTKRLRLYTDGAHNAETKQVGWGYVIVHGDTVLFSACGSCNGSAMEGEYQAVIRGLLAIDIATPVELVVDLDEVKWVIDMGWRGTKGTKPRIKQRRRTVQRLCKDQDVIVRVVASSSEEYNQFADTLARKGCGLLSKNAVKRAREKRNKIRRKAREAQNKLVGQSLVEVTEYL